jgi:hypothetical protein
MPDDVTPAEDTKSQRDSDGAILEMLSNEADEQAERTKHILQALVSAAVPLDMTTAEILMNLGRNMHILIHTAMDE